MWHVIIVTRDGGWIARDMAYESASAPVSMSVNGGAVTNGFICPQCVVCFGFKNVEWKKKKRLMTVYQSDSLCPKE